MKKILGFISFIFITFSFVTYSKANIIPDNVENNNTVKIINADDIFNVFRGMNYEEFINSELLYLLDSIGGIKEGYIESEVEIFTDKIIYIATKYYYQDYCFCGISSRIYEINNFDIEFYNIEYYDNQLSVNINDEIIISEISDYTYMMLNDAARVYFDNVVFDGITESNISDEIYFKCLDFIYIMKYEENSVYLGKDVHFIVEGDNPLPIDELLNDIVIKDKTDNVINTYEIDNNTYILDDEGLIEKGSYGFRIIARDEYGNTVIQNCIVDVVDGKGPTITINEINVSYKTKLNDESILKHCNIIDSSGVNSINLSYDDYKLNYNVPGSYMLTIVATDNNDNSSVLSGYINVIDDVSPKIICSNIEVNYPYNKLSKNDIIEYIMVKDDIDGIISKDRISLTDIDNYDEFYSFFGDYQFEVKVSDLAGNFSTKIITVRVIDNDYPQIEINKYIITVRKGQCLTKEQIIQKLIDSNQIESSEGVILNSLYFETINPENQYDYELILKDGTIINGIIKVDDTSFLKPNNEAKENKTPLLISCGIAVVMIILISSMGIIIYRKRH
ncbi:MAG: hypothetical protein ACI35S_00180 [Anaeroplasma sp.]